MVDRSQGHLMLTARLKPGTTEQAQVEMAGLAGQLASAYPREDKGKTAVVTRAALWPPDAIPDLMVASRVLMLLVLLVLLIACASWQPDAAAATGRRQEAAIKLAIGAPRGRLIREYLWESAALCAASAPGLRYGGGRGGVAEEFELRVSDMGLVLVLGQPPAGRRGTGIDVALVAIASVSTGLAPALYASSPALAQILGARWWWGDRRKRPAERTGDCAGSSVHAGDGGDGVVPAEPVQHAQ